MPTLELILLLAVAAQLPLFGLAVLLEFSGRKKRRMPEAEAEPEVEVSVERISAAVEAAQQALISEVQPEETRIPPVPTPHAPDCTQHSHRWLSR